MREHRWRARCVTKGARRVRRGASGNLRGQPLEGAGYYKGLIPALVEFVGNLGIRPAHEVLRQATQYAPRLDQALLNMTVADPRDRIWLLTRMGYFIGKYFLQKYSGSWFVDEIPGSRYFGRYVVGRYARIKAIGTMLDPFQIAQTYVDTPAPRHLESLLNAVDAELVATR
jgi:hypothetical protein